MAEKTGIAAGGACPMVAAAHALVNEVEAYVDSAAPVESIWQEVAAGSFHGDPSLMQQMAQLVGPKILEKQELTPVERAWLTHLLFTLQESKSAARALSGKPSRGAPKNAAKSLSIATSVVGAIMDEGAKSLDEAWEATAVQWSVDIRTVRKYWSEWKPVFSARPQVDKDGVECTFGEALKRMMQNNRGENS